MIGFDLDAVMFTLDSPRFSSILEKLPGVKWKNGIAWIPATIYNAGILSQFANGNATESAASLLKSFAMDHARLALILQGRGLPPGWDQLPSPFPLFNHQALAVHALQAMEF